MKRPDRNPARYYNGIFFIYIYIKTSCLQNKKDKKQKEDININILKEI